MTPRQHWTPAGLRPVVPDPVVVDRVCGGERSLTNTAERFEVVRRLSDRGESAEQIALRLDVTVRTVQRWRQCVRQAVSV